jgi:S-formylglutathione hydrolase FrmB
VALIQCSFSSDVLAVGTAMSVVLPQNAATQIGVEAADSQGAPFPVLYLLHGLSDDATAWTRYTSIERYATAHGVAVVMPQVQRSFYQDQAHGGRYWTFLTQELPEVVQAFFRVSDRREDTFVAGLSMGGYGAMRWALTAPERFAAAASLSGALDLAGRIRAGGMHPDIADAVFAGADTGGTDSDLLDLLAGLDDDARAALPRLYVTCGTEDGLLPDNERFLDQARRSGVEVTTDLRPGEHEWGYWDALIQDVLAWMRPTPASAS